MNKEPVEYPVLSQKLIMLVLMTDDLCLEHCIILILFLCLPHKTFKYHSPAHSSTLDILLALNHITYLCSLLYL